MKLYSISGEVQQNREEFVQLMPENSRLISYSTPRSEPYGSLFFVDSDASRESMEAAYPAAENWGIAPDEVAQVTVLVWQNLGFD